MLSHAILAVDYSPATEAMLACLPELRQLDITKVTLVYVLDINYPRSPEVEHRAHYQERLQDDAERLVAQGLTLYTDVRVGDPATEILAAAQEHGADCVVIGSHGHSLLGAALFGSVASAVTQRATLPVLVLPLEMVEREGAQRCRVPRASGIRHLLYPTDFSETAAQASDYLERIAADNVETITLLHVRVTDSAGTEAPAQLERIRARLTEHDARTINTVIVTGSAAGQILRYAHEAQVSLIIMGTRGRGALGELVLGSVSHAVLRRSQVPVLLIPPQHS